jgi:dihydrofolate reductase
MKKFSIIVAVDAAMGVGKDGGLPWHFTEDMKYFKAVTTAEYAPGEQNVVIMGRKTWESLPERYRPLPGRINVVISSNKDYSLPKEVLSFVSLESALAYAETKKGKVFMIGGAKIFAQTIEHVQCIELFLTKIDKDFSCDVFFPIIPSSFEKNEILASREEKGIFLQFIHISK